MDMGYEDLDVFSHLQLQRCIAGVRRLRGEADTKERRPITRDVLLQILTSFDKTTLLGATLHASFCLAFAGFLRIGEFTWSGPDLLQHDFRQWFITRRSVTLFDDHIELALPSSKTDPFRKGVTLSITSALDDACPVSSLRNLFKRFPSDPSLPLLLTRRLVTDVLRSTLRGFGYSGNYSSHFFRRGAATSAREAGLSDEEIQLLGRWRSDSYRLYIVTHPARILNASRRHQRVQFRPVVAGD